MKKACVIINLLALIIIMGALLFSLIKINQLEIDLRNTKKVIDIKNRSYSLNTHIEAWKDLEKIKNFNKSSSIYSVEPVEHILVSNLEIIEYSEPGFVYKEYIPLSRDLQMYVYKLSKEYDIDEMLIYAVMKLESRFDNIISPDGNDFGLMQINKVNHSWLSKKLGIVDYLNPYENILAGVYVLKDALNQGDNLHTSLMIYNCGIGRASELWKEGIFNNTYSRTVIENYEEYLKLRGE